MNPSDAPSTSPCQPHTIASSAIAAICSQEWATGAIIQDQLPQQAVKRTRPAWTRGWPEVKGEVCSGDDGQRELSECEGEKLEVVRQ